MILTGSEIETQVRLGRIILSPFDNRLINPNSYNYRLGSELLCASSDAVFDATSDEETWRSVRIGEAGIMLVPGILYLGSTLETIGSAHYTTLLSGRSSVGRLGVFVQVDADLGHVGTLHKWTLEITVAQPVIVYPGMRIGQVSFWSTSNNMSLYEGDYMQFDNPTRCKPWKLFPK